MHTKCGFFTLLCIFAHAQGYQIPIPDTQVFSGFAYPESGEQDPGRQNAMVRFHSLQNSLFVWCSVIGNVFDCAMHGDLMPYINHSAFHYRCLDYRRF